MRTCPAVLGLTVLLLAFPAGGQEQRGAIEGRVLDVEGHLVGDAGFPALSPDGKTIAYVRGVPFSGRRKPSLFVGDVTGGQAIEVFAPDGGILNVSWSPDGAELLVYSYSSVEGRFGTYIVPRLGGYPVPLGDKPYAAFSPDGSEIASYSWSPPGIRFTDRVTGEERIVPTRPFAESRGLFRVMDWSPSGAWVVYKRWGETAHSLWTLPVRGGEPHPLVEDSAFLASPRCAPGGDAVYYFRRAGAVTGLWKIPVSPQTGRATGSPRRLTGVLEADSRFFSLSGDGTRLVYARQRLSSNLALLPLEDLRDDGSVSPVRLTTGTGRDAQGRISPDGTRVVFVRGTGSSHLFIVSLEGGEPRQLTFFEKASGPVWSPEGTEIAFVSDRGSEDGVLRVWTVPARGGAPSVFPHSHARGNLLDWSPGTRILYMAPGARNYHLLDPETGEERPLLAEEAEGRKTGPLRVSPDGRSVAFSWWRPESKDGEPRAGMSVASVVDGSETLLTHRRVSPLRWSGEDTEILASELELGEGATILRFPIAGGQPEVVATVPERFHIDSDLTPDGSGLLVSVREHLSEIWMMENFDPDLRRKGAGDLAAVFTGCQEKRPGQAAEVGRR